MKKTAQCSSLTQELERAVGRRLEVRRVPIDSLHLDPANARSHGDRNLDTIQASLARFGQVEPLVVHKPTGRIIGGNGRVVAMKRLGWSEVDVVEVDLSEIEATALGIALNRTAELADWDEGALVELLSTLRAEDALEGVGFDEAEIDDLLAEMAEAPDPGLVEDQGPEEPPEKPVSKRGDLWVLGQHRLLCGDSTSAQDVQRVMAGEKAALLSTDPPYCVRYTGGQRPNDSGKDWSDTYREIDIEDLGEFLRGVLTAVLPCVRDNAAIYCWHAHLQYPAIDRVFEEFGILRHQPIIWVKPSSTFTYAYYRWQHEPCIFGWRQGNKPPHYLENKLTSVWEADWDGKARFTGSHPTTKPTRLFEIPMEQHTRPGEVVVEPFSGSGSQIVAAEKLGRRCRAIEIQPAFVDAAIRRWEKATGKEATLEETGHSFAQVTAERGEQ